MRSGIIKVPPEAGTTPHLEAETDGGTNDTAIEPEDKTRTGPDQPGRRTKRDARPELGPETTAGKPVSSSMDEQATTDAQPSAPVPAKVGDTTERRAAVTDAGGAGLNKESSTRLRKERRRRGKERTEQHADKNQVHDSQARSFKTGPGENVPTSREPPTGGTRSGNPPERQAAHQRDGNGTKAR